MAVRCLPAYAVALAAAIVLLPVNTRWQNSNNQYANELQADGPYKFLQAFTSNKLSYHDFYTTLPASQARQILSDENKIDNSAAAPASGAKTQHPNIVLVTMESMSGSSLQRFGKPQSPHPHARHAVPPQSGIRPAVRGRQPHGAWTGGAVAVIAPITWREPNQAGGREPLSQVNNCESWATPPLLCMAGEQF